MKKVIIICLTIITVGLTAWLIYNLVNSYNISNAKIKTQKEIQNYEAKIEDLKKTKEELESINKDLKDKNKEKIEEYERWQKWTKEIQEKMA